MQFITIDFETYYDKAFSLSKLTTEEYIRDELFEVIGVGVKVNDEPAEWFSGAHEEIKEFLSQFDWADSVAIAHNAMFDAAILSWVFDIQPAQWVDTLSLARAIDGLEVSGSLKAAAERYKLGVKGEEVIAALGKGRIDFTVEELEKYGKYCCNDCDLTWDLFNVYVDKVSPIEFKVIDLTIRMFSEPVLRLHKKKLREHLESVRTKKEELLAACEAEQDALLSNPKFAELLISLGVQPPVKVSPTTGREAWAFAKTDEGFKALAEHPDLRVQALVAARLGTKSTLEETRTERFIGIASRGRLPVPLNYYAAHTGRWGGSDSLNLQNLPSRGDSTLKSCILPPKGHVIIDCDSSQIEARVLAWLAGQADLVEAFAKKEDVYKLMASKIYSVPVEEVNKDQRFMGKTVVLGCFSEDTQVLTHTGWKRIVDVTVMDMVWDGEEWVIHQGVIPQGVKTVIAAHGLEATPDHEILTEHGWVGWSEVITNPSLFQSALRKANLPSSTGFHTPALRERRQGGTQLLDVLADGLAWLTATTSKPSALLDVMPAPKFLAQKLESGIGGMKTSCQMSRTEYDCLTESHLALVGATTLTLNNMRDMVGAESLFMKNGAEIEKIFLDIYSRLKVGVTHLKKLIALTLTKGMNPTIYGSQRAQRTLGIDEKFQSCSKSLMTYDIAYAGPRNRYTVATDAGPVIVHNCGYGMGAVKFQASLKVSGVDLSEEESKQIINTYRESNPAITALWKQANRTLGAMLEGAIADIGTQPQALYMDEVGFVLPSGYHLHYNDLKKDENGYSYLTRRGRVKIYGGKIIENVTQALARCIIAEQMVWISERYRPVLTVHDAIAIVAPEEDAEKAQEFIEKCMRRVPDWAEGLPLNCESGIGRNYGEC